MTRADLIVEQLSEEVDGTFNEAMKNIGLIGQFAQQYKSVVDDLITSKKNYATVVAKYSDNGSEFSTIATFPGMANAAPQYNNDEMSMDSNELNELGSLITEMEEQKELIQGQIHKLLRGINTGMASMTDTSSQILLFLSQAIESASSNGVYGSATLGEINT